MTPEPDPREGEGRSLPTLTGVQTGDLHRQRDVVEDGAPRHQSRLLEDDPDPAVAGARLAVADHHAPARRPG